MNSYSPDTGPRYVVAKVYKQTGLHVFTYYDRFIAEQSYNASALADLCDFAELYDSRDNRTIASFRLK